jgi:hypothetical protein
MSSSKFTKTFYLGPDQLPLILVSGLPRSGTSLMMNMLQAGGIPIITDNLRKADPDNPIGYFEVERVKKIPEGDTAWLAKHRGKAIKIIAPFIPYLPDDLEYKVIFMERDLDEILASQARMLSRQNRSADKEQDSVLKRIFQESFETVQAYMHQQPNFSYLPCSYSSIVKDPMPEISRIENYINIQLAKRNMADCVDPDLYRQRKPST